MNSNQIGEKPVMWIGETPFSATELLEAICMEKLQIPITKELLLKRHLEGIILDDGTEVLRKFKEVNKLIDQEKYNKYLENNRITEKILVQFLQRPNKLKIFKEERWGPRANALYLKNKEKYDKMSYYQLKSRDSDVMQEVYFRIKDGEETWESMSQKLPGANNPKIGPVAAEEIEPELIEEMKKLGAGKIVKPLKVKGEYVVAELCETLPTKFDSTLREQILHDEFCNWLKTETKAMLNKTRFAP